MNDNYLVHWGKGSTKKNHKYIAKIGNRYFYTPSEIEAFKNKFKRKDEAKAKIDSGTGPNGRHDEKESMGRSATYGTAQMMRRVGSRAINKTSKKMYGDTASISRFKNAREIETRTGEEHYRSADARNANTAESRALYRFTRGDRVHGLGVANKARSISNHIHNTEVAKPKKAKPKTDREKARDRARESRRRARAVKKYAKQHKVTAAFRAATRRVKKEA